FIKDLKILVIMSIAHIFACMQGKTFLAVNIQIAVSCFNILTKNATAVRSVTSLICNSQYLEKYLEENRIY
ncbi:MAG: hypothetical protein IJ733_10345, partial [Lachnospiraceae bacterium]|nr:hypothetical protein [Lachnospiraceae bacterium]